MRATRVWLGLWAVSSAVGCRALNEDPAKGEGALEFSSLGWWNWTFWALTLALWAGVLWRSGRTQADDRVAAGHDDRPARPLKILGVLYAAILVVVTLIALVHLRLGVPVEWITFDPVDITQGHPLVGVISNLGALGWCAGAVICFYSYALIRGRPQLAERAHFFLAGGIVTTVLGLDDFFLLHEDLLQRYLGLGEDLVISGYFLLLVLFLARFRTLIAAHSHLLLVNAVVMGFVANALDLPFVMGNAPAHLVPARIIVENGAKLMAIVSWAAYFAQHSRQVIRGLIGQRSP